MVAPRSAATTPYADFSVDRVSPLSLTRVYSSADYDVQKGGWGGVFGAGWHHDWEAYLTCVDSICTIRRGALASFRFALSGEYLSPDGSETWIGYTPYSSIGQPAHHNLLMKKPSGAWVAFLADGRELHFQTECTACDGDGTPFCTNVDSGGRARLVRVVDPAGNAIDVGYDPQNALLLRLTDGLGHALELRGASTCARNASELRYDGTVVASYAMPAGRLASVTDADGRVLRGYSYEPTGILSKVWNENGDPIVEFSYDATKKANGLVDAESDITARFERYCVGFVGNVGTPRVVCNSIANTTSRYRGRIGDTSSDETRTTTSVTYLNHPIPSPNRVTFGTSVEENGYRRLLFWSNEGAGSASEDSEGHQVRREQDFLGRVIHRIDAQVDTSQVVWSSNDIPVLRELPDPLPNDASEEWRAYGVTRAIAQGVTLDLDLATRDFRKSTLQSDGTADEVYDYSQAPSSIDAPGYVCASTPLPAGSVLCRQISSGWVTRGSGPALERHATFYSYDERGRLVRAYGPVNLDYPGPNDIPPIEERTYWADSESSARQGRLHELKRYSSPSAPPLVYSLDYDMFGVYRITAPDGSIVMILKDGRGRPTITAFADASGVVRAQTETRYYDGLVPRLRILPSGAAERYTYDDKGRLLLREYLSGDPEAAGLSPTLSWSESYGYDRAGNRIHAERRDAQGRVTWKQDRAFDWQHRVVWESNPGLPNNGRSWSYDPSGFLSGMIDEEGRAIAFTPDGLKRLQKVRRTGLDALGNPTAADVGVYQYGPHQDTLSSAADASTQSTSYGYDDFGRVQAVNSPALSRAGGAWYAHDARGNIIARGDQTVYVTYAYDGLDRPLSVYAHNSADGSSLTYGFVHDEPPYAGRLTRIIEPERTVGFTYDWAGRLASESVLEQGAASPLTTTYEYDVNGSLRQLIYPTGLAVQLDRDPATRRVSGVRSLNDATVYASDVTHEPWGPLSSLAFGNGRTLSQTFSLRYEPLTISSGPVVLSYGPTPAGDVGVVQDQSEDPSGCVRDVSRAAGYDFLDRLGNWSDLVGTGAGLCPADAIGSQAAALTYVNGQMASQVRSGQDGTPVLAFGYDLQGNVSAIGRYDATGSTLTQAVCLRHDPLGRLVLAGSTSSPFTGGDTVCTSDAEVVAAQARFKYDSRNRRVARQVNGQWTYVVSDPTGNPLSELVLVNGAWSKVRDYVWLEGRLLAQVEYAGATANTYYAHLDHLGTPRALTNQNGQVVWATYQRPYGEVAEKTIVDPVSGRTVVTNLRLPGQYDERLLGALGLQGPYYNWNRWYLPSVGRYLELDPIAKAGGFNGEYGPNWYGYAEGNPVSRSDRTGRAWWDDWFGSYPEPFRNWMHRQEKNGGPDFTKKEIEDSFEEWKRQGEPGPDNKGRFRGPKPPIPPLDPWEMEVIPLIIINPCLLMPDLPWCRDPEHRPNPFC
jgi:RHS repeat-associated protein